MNVGLAVFVKTVGRTPVKTRLAEKLGTDFANEFYRLSVNAVEGVLRSVQDNLGITVYWAVAEPEALVEWESFPVIYQGSGGLAEKMDRVYDRLLQRHSHGLLLASDSPQISQGHIQSALNLFLEHDFVFGPAEDGGFYLFGGGQPVSLGVWEDVEYSQPTTLQQLSLLLQQHGSCGYIDSLSDVDVLSDLNLLLPQLQGTRGMVAEQAGLTRWLQTLLAGGG